MSAVSTRRFVPHAFFAGLAVALFSASGAGAAGDTLSLLKDRKIGYALSEQFWAVFQSPDGKTECPNGLNDGPREQFKVLFPDDGKPRTLLETQLAREAEVWFPSTSKEHFVFHEATGPTSYGLNLDGKIGPNDFTSPEGEKGVDNQLFRAIGCVQNHRGPDGSLYRSTNTYIQQHKFDRWVIELSDVDSLVNDPDVKVSLYRTLDELQTDATGDGFSPGGSQTIDTRWGKEFIRHFHGKIVNGTLDTDPTDIKIPANTMQDTSIHVIGGARFRLKLTPERAEGLLAGYTDVEAFYRQLNESWSTHLQSYGQESAPSLYRALRRLADGYPDSKTGENTAISSALKVKFIQVFVRHPPQEVSEDEKASNTRLAAALK